MLCLKCKHQWPRTRWQEFISLFSTCPQCGSRWL